MLTANPKLTFEQQKTILAHNAVKIAGQPTEAGEKYLLG
jgi:hypothetical protein